MRKSFFLLITIGVFFLLMPGLQGKSPSAQSDCPSCPSFGVQRSKEKREAPPFSLKSLNGVQVSLGDFKGKPVLLKFWATWCPSCIEELPAVEKFAQGKKDQLCVFLLAIDGERESRVQRIIKNNKVTLPVLLDVKEKIARTYKVTFVPVTFLVDREGMIAGTVVGERDWTSSEASSVTKELLNLR